MDEKKISVLMATYNGEQYIKEAIESIIKQTFGDFVLYLHDDGSTDDTCKIIDYYVELMPDKIRLIEHEPLGSATANFMYMLERVDSDWYMFADQDDVWAKDKIEKMYQVALTKVNQDERAVLLFSDMIVVDKDLRRISDSFFNYSKIDVKKNRLSQIIAQNIVPGCACMFNKKLRREALKYKRIENIIYHDWWLACVAAATGNIIFLNESLVQYRQHDNNVVGADIESIKNNLQSFFKIIWGHQIKKSHARTVRFIKQARELNNIEIVDCKDKRMIEEICSLSTKNKFERVSIFIRFGIHRSKRDIWMYLTL